VINVDVSLAIDCAIGKIPPEVATIADLNHAVNVVVCEALDVVDWEYKKIIVQIVLYRL